MSLRNRLMPVSAIALALSLSACGGSGSDVVSTNPPPSPTPSPTYRTLAELTGNQTFDGAGATYRINGNVLEATGSFNFANGPKLAYNATNDTFTVTLPSGASSTFTPANVVSRTDTQLVLNNGSNNLILINPSVNGVRLSYTQFASYVDTNNNTQPGQFYLIAGGVPTIGSDMPRSGTATYKLLTGGRIRSGGVSGDIIGTGSNGTMTVNFGGNTLTIDMALATAATDFGRATGTGTLTAGNPSFTGTMTSANGSGQFGGSFFGPQAIEVGFGWFLSGTDFYAVGLAAGKKD